MIWKGGGKRMADREKVIKGLEGIIDYFFDIYRKDTDSYKCAKAQEYSDCAIDAIALLKEQKAMVKPTKCPCGELFDAKDSLFCPKCGCAYGELSGRYTNIGR